MLTNEEMRTLEHLKGKAKFQNQLIRAFEKSFLSLNGTTREAQDKELRHFFLEESLFWKRKRLTESEFNRALELLKER
jgi:hypothetical protein